MDHQPAKRQLYTVGTLVYTMSGLVLLFVWLLWGDFALSMRDRSVGPLTEKFLLRQGASNDLKQLLTLFLPTFIALLISPIVSYKSDRLRGPWGRRIPFLLFPTPIAGLAMIGIAFSEQMGMALFTGLGHAAAAEQTLQQAAASHTIGVFTVFWTIFEVAVIVSGSVFGGLINDVVPRAVLGRFFGLFRQISLFDGILFNALLFKHAEEHFTLMFAMIGILFGGGFALMCLKVKEGNYPPPPAEDPHLSQVGGGFFVWLVQFFKRFFSAMAGYMRECFAQPHYLLCFAMFTFGALTFRPINDFTIRYAAQLKMPDADYGNLVALSYLVSLTIAFPLGTLVDRFHPLRLAIVSLVLYVITALYGAFLIKDTFTFGIALVAHTILSGTYFTCTASLGQALFPRSKFTQYASAGGILTSLSMLVFAMTSGRIIDRFDNNYHLTFWAGLVFSVITLCLTIIVYFRFMRLGGPEGYVAPGDTDIVGKRGERPTNLLHNFALYFCGAAVGMLAGYLLAFVVQYGKVKAASAGLATFHTLILSDSDVRGVTMVCLAFCIIPGAMVGVWASSAKSPTTRTGH